MAVGIRFHGTVCRVFCGAILGVAAFFYHPLSFAQQHEPSLAATPPMGWNSWDSYGTTVTEEQIKANADWMAAHLKQFGWQYITVDMEWFVKNPVPEGNAHDSLYSLDAFGRYAPAPNRFLSAQGDAGFKPLADYVHGLGLKFGIHILQGIPKQAVEQNTAIEGTPSLHARDAANTAGTCVWNFDNYDLKNTAAGQAYYDSIARLYASWGVDLIKVDCIATHPYKGDEIRMLSEAIRKTGRPIVLSLSPGPAPLEKLDEMRAHAQMWRISNDTWDLWHSSAIYPQGVVDQFRRAQAWAALSEPGHWPDADMLPLGYLGPAPGWGKARQTQLTHDEQKTLLTLWAMMRSPMMMGGDLPHSDAWTTSLLTNRDAFEVDQHSIGNHVATHGEDTIVWTAKSTTSDKQYVAVFNTGAGDRNINYVWKDLGLAEGPYRLRDLWEGKDLGEARDLQVAVPSHGTALFALTRP